MIGIILTEIRAIIRLRSVQMAGLLAALAISTQFRSAAILAGFNGLDAAGPIYYVSQLFLALIVLGNCTTIIAGGALGANDFPWRTWGIKLVHVSKEKLIWAKILALCALSVITAITVCTSGYLLSVAKNVAAYSYYSFFLSLKQLAATAYILFYWGVLSFTLCYGTQSFAFGATICLIYSFFERMIYSFTPQFIKSILPVWNQNGFLSRLFSNCAHGAVIIPPDSYFDPLISICIFSAYIVIALVLLFYLALHREYE